jgi:rRNA maturation endonuclease Nob1
MELNLQIEEYLKHFKVYNPKTLFPPSFENLQKNLCPICGRKLYLTRNKKMAYCKSKQNDKFAITSKRLLSLGGSLKA